MAWAAISQHPDAPVLISLQEGSSGFTESCPLLHAGLDLVLACSEMSIESSSLMELVDDWLCTGEFWPMGVGSGRPLPVVTGHLHFEYFNAFFLLIQLLFNFLRYK